MRPRPRRPARGCASRRPAAARPRPSWRARRGSSRPGTPPDAIRAITFNKRAALEMTERLDAAVAPLGVAPGEVRVRTFHALGSRDPARCRRRRRADGRSGGDAGRGRAVGGRGGAAPARHGRVTAQGRARRLGRRGRGGPGCRPGRPRVRRLRARRGGVAAGSTSTISSCARSPSSRGSRGCWRAGASSCRELLVDEVQDVDRAQLRLALLLAAPANRIFLVGDDDQSIYGWRLADVRRILGLDERLPGLRRVDLEVNYRCPRRSSNAPSVSSSTTPSASRRSSGPDLARPGG